MPADQEPTTKEKLLLGPGENYKIPGQLIVCNNIFTPEPSGAHGMLIVADSIMKYYDKINLPTADLLSKVMGVDIEEVDLTDHVIVPGLFDTHTHIHGGGGEQGLASDNPAIPVKQIVDAGLTGVGLLRGTNCSLRTPQTVIKKGLELNEYGIDAWAFIGGYVSPYREPNKQTLIGNVQDDLVHLNKIMGVKVTLGDPRSYIGDEEYRRAYADLVAGGKMSGKSKGILHIHLGQNSKTPGGLSRLRPIFVENPTYPGHTQITHVNRSEKVLESVIEFKNEFPDVSLDLTCQELLEADSPRAENEGVPVTEAFFRLQKAGVADNKTTVSSDAGGTLTRTRPDGSFDPNSPTAQIEMGPKNLCHLEARLSMEVEPRSDFARQLHEKISANLGPSSEEPLTLARDPRDLRTLQVINNAKEVVLSLENPEEEFYKSAAKKLQNHSVPTAFALMSSNLANVHSWPYPRGANKNARLSVFIRNENGELERWGVILPGRALHRCPPFSYNQSRMAEEFREKGVESSVSTGGAERLQPRPDKQGIKRPSADDVSHAGKRSKTSFAPERFSGSRG